MPRPPGAWDPDDDVDCVDLTGDSPPPRPQARYRPQQQQRVSKYLKTEPEDYSRFNMGPTNLASSGQRAAPGVAVNPHQLRQIIATSDPAALQTVVLNLCQISPALSGAIARGLAPHSTYARNLIDKQKRGYQPQIKRDPEVSYSQPYQQLKRDAEVSQFQTYHKIKRNPEASYSQPYQKIKRDPETSYSLPYQKIKPDPEPSWKPLKNTRDPTTPDTNPGMKRKSDYISVLSDSESDEPRDPFKSRGPVIRTQRPAFTERPVSKPWGLNEAGPKHPRGHSERLDSARSALADRNSPTYGRG